jgi:hypothetical protein
MVVENKRRNLEPLFNRPPSSAYSQRHPICHFYAIYTVNGGIPAQLDTAQRDKIYCWPRGLFPTRDGSQTSGFVFPSSALYTMRRLLWSEGSVGWPTPIHETKHPLWLRLMRRLSFKVDKIHLSNKFYFSEKRRPDSNLI